MSIQSALNNDSMNYIPTIKGIIANADAFEANQMQHYALRKMMNSDVRIVDMTNAQIVEFQENLIGYYIQMGWI